MISIWTSEIFPITAGCSSRKKEAEYRAKRERYLQIESRVTHKQAAISRSDPSGGRLLKKKMHAVKSLGRRMDKKYEKRTRRPVQETAILAFFPDDISQPSDKEILDLDLPELIAGEGTTGMLLARDIRLTVRGQEKIVIVGDNGSGKTTLLKAIGKIMSERDDITLGVMPQDYLEKLPQDKLPAEFLAPTGLLEDRQRAFDLPGSMKYTADEMEHAVSDLSGDKR